MPCPGSGMPGGILEPAIVHWTCAIATSFERNLTLTSVIDIVLSRKTNANAAVSLLSISGRPFHHQQTTLTTSPSVVKSAA